MSRRHPTDIIRIYVNQIMMQRLFTLVGSLILLTATSTVSGHDPSLDASVVFPNRWANVSMHVNRTFAFGSAGVHLAPYLSSGLGQVGEGIYVQPCNQLSNLTGTAWMMRLTMGAVVDYFRPRSSSMSYCDLIQSNLNHQWSSDGLNWRTPSYHIPSYPSQYMGGSSG